MLRLNLGLRLKLGFDLELIRDFWLRLCYCRIFVSSAISSSSMIHNLDWTSALNCWLELKLWLRNWVTFCLRLRLRVQASVEALLASYVTRPTCKIYEINLEIHCTKSYMCSREFLLLTLNGRLYGVLRSANLLYVTKTRILFGSHSTINMLHLPVCNMLHLPVCIEHIMLLLFCWIATDKELLYLQSSYRQRLEIQRRLNSHVLV